MSNSRWLEKNQYARIKRKGKKLGADHVDTRYIYHCAIFNHAYVWFAFRPFFCEASLRNNGLKTNDFSNKEELDIIKADLDKALEFVEYLKGFNAEMEKANDQARNR